MDIVWQLIAFYCLASVVIGVSICTLSVLGNLKEIKSSMRSAEANFLMEHVQQGHLQEEIYGERVIYLEKDLEGEAAMKTIDRIRRIQQRRPMFLVFLVWISGCMTCSIQWPVMLYDKLETWISDLK